MDDGLKQRIVGAFVLVAIGVVFIPVIFDRERIEKMDHTTQIPPAPHIVPIDIRPPVESLPDEPLAEPAKMFIPDKNTQQQAEVEIVEAEPVLTDKGTPNAWVLQVASYRFEGHAKERRDALKVEGYDAYVEQINAEQGKMNRLYVGPFLNKQKSLAAKREIDKLLGVKSMLLKFEP